MALFATYSYRGFSTDRDGEMLELEADHRRHAEIENAIRDLKYGVGLNHLPSGRFAANAAWLAVQVMAHNLTRWTARIGLGEQIVTTKTLRRRFFSLAGRLTRSARCLTLHLPQRWPWETQFSRAGTAASDSTSYLTATSEPEPPNGQPNVPANSCQPGPGAPLAASSPHHLALPNIRRLSLGLPAANEDRHRHPLPEIGLRPSPPLAPHRPFHCCNVIPSVDSG